MYRDLTTACDAERRRANDGATDGQLLVDYFVHGRGRGHASRARSIVPRLNADGCLVRVHGGGDALDLLEPLDCRERSCVRSGWRAPAALAARAAADVRRFIRTRPDVVVSDGDQPAIVAARALRIPCVAIGHDLTFSCCRLPPDLDRLRVLHQRVNAAIPTYLASLRIAVHFLPTAPRYPRVWVARPDGYAAASGEEPADDLVLCYFRDGNGQAVVRSAIAAGFRVAWFGPGSRAGRGIVACGAGAAAFARALRRCSGVIASAGSNLLAECALLGKPILALYARDDHEQALNASLATRAGMAVARCLEEVTDTDVRVFLRRARRCELRAVSLAESLLPVSVVATRAVRQLGGAPAMAFSRRSAT